MKKILFVATITQHFYYFHLPYLKMFKDEGWQVDVASSGDIELPNCDNRYEIPIQRSPFSTKNVQAYKELKKIIDENDYDIIHCHTPMGGLLGRLAAKSKRKKGTRVLYTAHGFHFYKGGPLMNWLIYFPIEYTMSLLTDCLITINEEDFERAKKFFKAKEIKKVNGVGYNNEKYFPVSREEKYRVRKEKGYSEDEKILIYVAELNKNKNQSMLLNALKEILKTGKNVRLLLVGTDNYNGFYQNMAGEMGIQNNVEFLGQRDDVNDLLHMSDICVASSIREGLPVNVMEALGCGLPVVLSDNRGQRVLGVNNKNGFIVKTDDYMSMAEKITLLLDDEKMYDEFSENAVELIKPFSKESVVPEMIKIYKDTTDS